MNKIHTPARLTPPLKWHGGKHYLARKIVELMPRHMHYVEPFFGGGRVLFARDPADPRFWASDTSSTCGVSEVANDLHGRLMNFWRVLRDEDTFRRFRRMVEATPFGRPLWVEAHAHKGGGEAVADAVAFFVDARQSRAGLMKTFTPLTRSRTRRGMNGNVSEWIGTVDGLADIHARLRPVILENLPAVEVIQREDGPGTLYYCDPPYLHETRTATEAYAFEMTENQHRELLAVLRAVQGKVMLSGYPSKLYDGILRGWNRHTFDIPNHAAGGKKKDRETEVLWCNF